MKRYLFSLYFTISYGRIDRDFGTVDTTEKWEEYKKHHEALMTNDNDDNTNDNDNDTDHNN